MSLESWANVAQLVVAASAAVAAYVACRGLWTWREQLDYEAGRAMLGSVLRLRDQIEAFRFHVLPDDFLVPPRTWDLKALNDAETVKRIARWEHVGDALREFQIRRNEMEARGLWSAELEAARMRISEILERLHSAFSEYRRQPFEELHAEARRRIDPVLFSAVAERDEQEGDAFWKEITDAVQEFDRAVLRRGRGPALGRGRTPILERLAIAFAGALLGGLASFVFFPLEEFWRPALSSAGERFLESLYPPELEWEVRRQDTGSLLMDITNLGEAPDTIQRLMYCPHGDWSIFDRKDVDQSTPLRASALPGWFEFESDGTKHRLVCGGMLNLRLLEDDPVIAARQTRNARFEAPPGATVPSEIEDYIRGANARCPFVLVAEKAPLSIRVLQCQRAAAEVR